MSRRTGIARLLPILAIVVACSTPTAPSASPTLGAAPTVAATAADSAVPSAPAVAARPSPFPGQPAIADPFWLLHNGSGHAEYTDKNGTVIRSDLTEEYQVLNGGTLQGTILIDGELIGSLTVTVTEGSNGVQADPIEEQFGPLDPTQWTATQAESRSIRTYGTTTVYLRAFELVDDVPSTAYWWDAEHAHWFSLFVHQASIDAVLVAMLGARRT